MSIPQNMPNIDLKSYEKYISKNLYDGALKDGKVDYGKVFENLGHKGITTFHQIQTLFEKGVWINDKSALDELTRQFTLLKKLNLNNTKEVLDAKGQSKLVKSTILDGVGQMKAICKMLKNLGNEHEKELKTVEEELDSLESFTSSTEAKWESHSKVKEKKSKMQSVPPSRNTFDIESAKAKAKNQKEMISKRSSESEGKVVGMHLSKAVDNCAKTFKKLIYTAEGDRSFRKVIEDWKMDIIDTFMLKQKMDRSEEFKYIYTIVQEALVKSKQAELVPGKGLSKMNAELTAAYEDATKALTHFREVNG